MPSVACAGNGQRQQHLPEDREARGVVEHRRFVELARDGAEILRHQEDAERRRPGPAGSARDRCCAGRAALNSWWRGDDHRLLGNGEAEQHETNRILRPGKFEPREAIAGERRQDQHAGGHAERDDHAVEQPAEHLTVAERCRGSSPACRARAKTEPVSAISSRIVLERQAERPQQRRHHDDAQRDHGDQRDAIAGCGPDARQRALMLSSLRRSRRRYWAIAAIRISTNRISDAAAA